MEKRDEVLIDRALSIKKYGASSECCLRPCDYKILAQYCRESPDLLDAKEIQEKLGFTNSTTSTASYSNVSLLNNYSVVRVNGSQLGSQDF